MEFMSIILGFPSCDVILSPEGAEGGNPFYAAHPGGECSRQSLLTFSVDIVEKNWSGQCVTVTWSDVFVCEMAPKGIFFNSTTSKLGKEHCQVHKLCWKSQP